MKLLPGFELSKYCGMPTRECLRLFGSLETVCHGVLVGTIETIENRLPF
jgi:hypothetical protein